MRWRTSGTREIKRRRLFSRIQEDPGKFVRTNQVVTCFFTLALGAFTLPQTAGYIRRFLAVKLAMAPGLAAGLALAAAFFVVAFFLVCLGVIIPKHVAAKSPIRFCYKALSVVEWAIKLLSPFTWLISVAAFVVLKAVGIDIRSSNEKVTEEDIMYMVNEGHDQGVLEASEAEMITNIFEFDDKVASDIMTHRKNVVALESTMTLKETVDFIVKEANNSRFPVYEEDIDNIVGVLHMRDVLYFAEQEEYLDRPISQIDGLLRSAHFAPEAKNINALFKEMQSEKIHMEIVIDEYGQTAGIVTMEDILEEIVGNIMDEYDNEEPDIVVKENGSFQLSGMTPLDDVEDALEMEFDEDDKDNFDTLNGFLISRLGHLPEDDEKGQVVFGGYRFSIVKAENKIIQTVTAERDAGPEHEKENEG